MDSCLRESRLSKRSYPHIAHMCLGKPTSCFTFHVCLSQRKFLSQRNTCADMTLPPFSIPTSMHPANVPAPVAHPTAPSQRRGQRPMERQLHKKRLLLICCDRCSLVTSRQPCSGESGCCSRTLSFQENKVPVVLTV